MKDWILDHKIKLIMIGVALLLPISLLFTPTTDEEPTFVIPLEEEQSEPNIQYIYIDVKGEVLHPGVYKIAHPARLFQIIELAGGFTSDADELAVNLARYVSDQEAVYIPHKEEEYPNITTPKEDDDTTGVININTATSEELQQLNGIGPATAQAIISYREEHGPFSKIEELLDVPGIGEATLQEITPHIVV